MMGKLAQRIQSCFESVQILARADVPPAALRAARDRLIDGLSPGTYLLLNGARQGQIVEKTWWGRRLMRGGQMGEPVYGQPSSCPHCPDSSDSKPRFYAAPK